MTGKTLGMLGMARRANKTSLGHDAALESLNKGDSKLIVTSSDASERLCGEFENACKRTGTAYLKTKYTMNETGAALGAKTTAVLSINDEGFAKRLNELIREDD